MSPRRAPSQARPSSMVARHPSDRMGAEEASRDPIAKCSTDEIRGSLRRLAVASCDGRSGRRGLCGRAAGPARKQGSRRCVVHHPHRLEPGLLGRAGALPHDGGRGLAAHVSHDRADVHPSTSPGALSEIMPAAQRPPPPSLGRTTGRESPGSPPASDESRSIAVGTPRRTASPTRRLRTEGTDVSRRPYTTGPGCGRRSETLARSSRTGAGGFLYYNPRILRRDIASDRGRGRRPGHRRRRRFAQDS